MSSYFIATDNSGIVYFLQIHEVRTKESTSYIGTFTTNPSLASPCRVVVNVLNTFDVMHPTLDEVILISVGLENGKCTAASRFSGSVYYGMTSITISDIEVTQANGILKQNPRFRFVENTTTTDAIKENIGAVQLNTPHSDPLINFMIGLVLAICFIGVGWAIANVYVERSQ